MMATDSEIYVKKTNLYLDKWSRFDKDESQLDITHSHGFFSNCTITLSCLTRIYPAERYVKVNWPRQDRWRDDDQAGRNLFDSYFLPNNNLDTHAMAKLSPLNHHGVYRDLSFDKLKPYIQNYFAPTKIVRRKIDEFVQKYGIDYDNTVTLWYRGTDKFTELALIPPRYYVAEAQRLIRTHPKLRVLIQTDQEQIRDILINELGESAFYLNELPVSKSLTGIHAVPSEERGLTNFEFGTALLAVVQIASKCKYLITHTGNVGLWIYLYRGNAMNTYQLKPRLPNLISQYDSHQTQNKTLQENIHTSALEEENYELRTENEKVHAELDAINASYIYRSMKSLSAKMDQLLPDNTMRGKLRKRVTKAFAAKRT